MTNKQFIRKIIYGSLIALAGVAVDGTRGTTVPLVAAQTPAVAGVLSFTDITATAGTASRTSGSHGAFWGDATGDGLPDLYLTYNECRSGDRANRFYRNLGGTFIEEAEARGIANRSGGTHGGAWVDLDNDGDYDLLNGTTYAIECSAGDVPPLPNNLFQNDGGTFVNRTPPAMAAYADYTRSILGFDMDKDGDLDIFAVNGDLGSRNRSGEQNELYRNDGGFNFTAITTTPLTNVPSGQAATDTDYDGDGDVDIIIPNIYGTLNVMRNDGGGTFTAVSPASIGIVHTAATGITSADLNNDGRLDLLLIDQDREPLRRLGYDRMLHMYLNAGGGTFSYAGGIPSGTFGGYTAGVADLDNDGDLDVTLPALPFVLLNDGQANFTFGPSYPTPRPAAGCRGSECMQPDPRTVAFADIDSDGDLDSVVTVKFGPFVLIRNNFNAGNWLKVQLVAPNGQAGAFGAKVRVFRRGTTSMIALREAHNVYGYLAQDDPVMHVGLGDAQTVDVEVTFLDGTKVTALGVSANRTIVMTGTGLVDLAGPPDNLTSLVNGSNVLLSWQPGATGGAPAGYQLEAGNAPGASNLVVFRTGATTSLAASAPTGTYYVRVRALNAAGLSPPSRDIVVSVGGGCAPNAPGTLNVTRSGSLVALAWSTPSAGFAPSAYTIEVGSAAGATNTMVFDTGGTATTLSASAPPGRYYVRVRGRTACATGPASNEVVIDVP